MDRFAAVTEIMKIQVHDLCLSGWPCENLVVICPSKTQLDCGQKLEVISPHPRGFFTSEQLGGS